MKFIDEITKLKADIQLLQVTAKQQEQAIYAQSEELNILQNKNTEK